MKVLYNDIVKHLERGKDNAKNDGQNGVSPSTTG